jgi:hypothetical protein
MLGYLDAGSGSIIASAAAAGFAGAAVGAKMGWQRLTGKFKRDAADEAEGEQAPEADAAVEDTSAG